MIKKKNLTPPEPVHDPFFDLRKMIKDLRSIKMLAVCASSRTGSIASTTLSLRGR